MPGKHKSYVQIGKETTPGVAVAATRKFEVAPVIGSIPDPSLYSGQSRRGGSWDQHLALHGTWPPPACCLCKAEGERDRWRRAALDAREALRIAEGWAIDLRVLQGTEMVRERMVFAHAIADIDRAAGERP